MDRIYRCKSSCFWHYYMKRIDNIYIYFYIHFYKCAEILIQHLHQYGRTLELSGHWEIFNFGNRNRQTLFIPWTLFRAFSFGGLSSLSVCYSTCSMLHNRRGINSVEKRSQSVNHWTGYSNRYVLSCYFYCIKQQAERNHGFEP